MTAKQVKMVTINLKFKHQYSFSLKGNKCKHTSVQFMWMTLTA